MNKITKIQEFVDDPEVVSFIGKDYAHYRDRWLRADHKTNDINKIQKVPCLNLLCLLCPPLWLGYRKQLPLFMAFLAVMALFTVFEIFSGILIPVPVYLALFVILSLYSSGYYFSYVRNFFERIESTSEEDRERLIRKHGGTSKIQAVIYSAVFLGTLLLVYQLGLTLADSLGLDTSHITD